MKTRRFWPIQWSPDQTKRFLIMKYTKIIKLFTHSFWWVNMNIENIFEKWLNASCYLLLVLVQTSNILALQQTFHNFIENLAVSLFWSILIQNELNTIFAPFQPFKLFVKVYWICFNFILKYPYSQKAFETFCPFTILSPLFTPCLSVLMSEKTCYNRKPPQH